MMTKEELEKKVFKNEIKLNDIGSREIEKAFRVILEKYNFPEARIKELLHKTSRKEYTVPFYISSAIFNKEVEELNLSNTEADLYFYLRCPGMYNLSVNLDGKAGDEFYNGTRVSALEQPNEGFVSMAERRG